MINASERLVVALDMDDLGTACRLVRDLMPEVSIFKVGMQLYFSTGGSALEAVRRLGAQVFADLKLHDIPNTVGQASRALVRQGADIFNIHLAGGRAMAQAAGDAAASEAARLSRKRPLVLGVTVLTSLDQEALERETGVPRPLEELVVERARNAKDWGLDGVVASAREAAAIRMACGQDFVILTPGIRPSGGESADQRRTATPAEALRAGATHLVVGRPVTAASDPKAAVRLILAEMEAAQ